MLQVAHNIYTYTYNCCSGMYGETASEVNDAVSIAYIV
jgi:hypothetical protein